MRLEFVFGASDTTKTVSIPKTGGGLFSKVIKIKIPDIAAVTGTLVVKDNEGDQLYSKASIAENAVTIDDTKTVPIDPDGTVVFTLSGAPTVACTIVVVFYLVS
jgi:hypothetical protein